MKSRTLGAAIAAGLSLAAGAAPAAMVDFEGIAAGGGVAAVGNAYAEDGFTLTNQAGSGDALVVSVTAGNNASGSDFYAWDASSGNNPAVLAHAGAGVFNLASLDVGSAAPAVGDSSFDIVGNLSAGGTVVHNVVAASAFESVVLNWTGLTSVEFSSTSLIPGAIDNLDVSAVPLPPALGLLGVGLLGIASRRRAAG